MKKNNNNKKIKSKFNEIVVVEQSLEYYTVAILKNVKSKKCLLFIFSVNIVHVWYLIKHYTSI